MRTSLLMKAAALCCLVSAASAHIRVPVGGDDGLARRLREMPTGADEEPSLMRAASAAVARHLQHNSQPIAYPSYASVVSRLQALSQLAPDLVEVWSAQDRYGTPSPGMCREAGGSSSRTIPCKHWFVAISNRTPASASVASPQAERPQVFFSGNLHGDETVGPVTLITLAELLVHAAVAAPGTAGHNPWLQRLVNTRKIVMIPITNPLGYDASPYPTREETTDRGDPNRDFPYNNNPLNCMRSATARAVNEVWREHIFQMGVTFHGGMQAIAYEWGSYNHQGHGSESPDDAASRLMGLLMKEMAGAFRGQSYPVNRMNPLVYPVDGGMEDWSYAGSWDTAAVLPCAPRTLGGYPAEKTTYNSAQLRALNVLVETWDDKNPNAGELGSDGGPGGADMLVVSGAGDGHVPRNLRLALSVIDLVEPYVVHTKAVAAPVEVPPSSSTGSTSGGGGGPAAAAAAAAAVACAPADAPHCVRYLDQYAAVHQLTVSANGSAGGVSLSVGWDVGGSIAVDGTRVAAGWWDPRVPPSVLTDAAAPLPAAQGLRDAVANVELSEGWLDAMAGYGLSTAEASFFGRYVHGWQRYLAGYAEAPAATAGLADAATLYTGASSSGVTRWSFGQVGAAAPAAEPSPTPSPGSNLPHSAVAGAPDLTGAPFATRFTDCLRVVPALVTRSGTDRGASSVQVRVQQCSAAAEGSAPAAAAEGSSGATATQTGSSLSAMFYVALANVDSAWRQQGTPEPANTPPQSHVVNIRTNGDWWEENGNYRARGRRLWASEPVFVALTTQYTAAEVAASVSPSPSPAAAATATATAAAAAGTATTVPTTTAAAASASAAPASHSVKATHSAKTSPSSSHKAATTATAAATRSPAADGATETDARDPIIPSLGIRASSLVMYSGAVTALLAGIAVTAGVRRWRARRSGSSGSSGGSGSGAGRAVPAIIAASGSSSARARRLSEASDDSFDDVGVVSSAASKAAAMELAASARKAAAAAAASTPATAGKGGRGKAGRKAGAVTPAAAAAPGAVTLSINSAPAPIAGGGGGDEDDEHERRQLV